MLVEKIKNGRKMKGAIYQTSGGLAFVAERKPGDVFKVQDGKGGFKTISDAVTDGSAEWSIDEEFFQTLRYKGIRYFGFWIRKLNMLYVTTIDSLTDSSIYKLRNYSSSGGALKRHIPLQHFRLRSLRPKL